MLEKLRSKIISIFKTPDRQPPTGEVAVSESILYKGVGFRPYNPDLLVRRKGGLHVYDEMRLDDGIKMALSLKKHAVLAPGWYIEPASEEPEDEEIAEFVDYVFRKMQGSINDFLLQALTALDYGYSITEIIWNILKDGPYAGKIGIKALKGKKPHHFEFDVDEYSNLKPKGLVQSGLLFAATQKGLPISKFVIYTYQKEFGNWYGISDLRAAYRAWWSKDNIIKFWNIYLERFGSPTVLGKYRSNDPTSITNLKTILKNLQNKTSITFRKDEFEIELLEPQRRSTADYEAALEFYNRSIARSILIPDRLMASGETGAYAQAKVHFDVFLMVIDKLRQDLEEIVMEEQVIRRLIGWNFQNIDRLPKFRFNPLTEEQKVRLAEAFTNAVQKGAILPTLDDENHIRKILNFPEKSNTAEIETGEEGPEEGQEPEEISEDEGRVMAVYGGPGSGNWGHAGRPGEIGGSSSRFVPARGSKEELHKLARERGIRIPPGWTDVQVSANPDSALQVVGRDSKGRKQYIYSAEHAQKAAAEKFSRLKDFTKEYPQLKSKIEADFDHSDEAKVLYLISKTGFRLGSHKDTKAKQKAYGASTLKKEHIRISGDTIRFEFTGKKGVKITTELKDRKLARHFSKRKDELFDTSPEKVRNWLKKNDGNFLVKDFRTYIGTVEALKAIRSISKPKSGKEFKKAVTTITKKVAAKLGNTPTVAKNSYIAPEVWDILKE